MDIYSFIDRKSVVKAVDKELRDNGIKNFSVGEFTDNKLSIDLNGRLLTCSYAEAILKPKKLVAYVKRKQKELK